jgi:predicted DCC family thiol-disulfide oxidoreductase YuxK
MSEVNLLYDEDCGFCRWSVDKVLRLDPDRRVRPIALQSDEARALLRDVDPETRMLSAHVVTKDGHVHSGGALAEPLFSSLRWGKPVAAVTRALPGTTDRVYRLIARNRYRIGGWLGQDACRVDVRHTDGL